MPGLPDPRNGLGLTSLILGILAVVLALVPFGIIFSAPAAIVGLALGLSNRGRLRRGVATNRLATVFGCVLSALGIILAIIFVAAVYHGLTTSS
jgi:uncharacterized protein YqfA (UPF0365 family)